MALEKIVRPFQNGDVFTARVNAPVQPAILQSPDVATLKWGGTEEAKWSEEPMGWINGFQGEWVEEKSKRQTEKVRVTNPDDDSQFIDLERIKRISFKHTQTSQELTFPIEWPGS